LILASEVRPMNLKMEDPLETGKNRKAKQMFPTKPKASAEFFSLASHLYNNALKRYASDFCISLSFSTVFLFINYENLC
jgi:hypothetical protein